MTLMALKLFYLNLLIWLLLTFLYHVLSCKRGEDYYGIGHLKPFGTSKHPILTPHTHDGFVSPQEFSASFVKKLKPVLMKNALKNYPAYKLWEDDYFLRLPISEDRSIVHIETTKKENRKQHTYDIPFKEFVSTYNNSGHYMVASFPPFLAKDFYLPWSLQCKTVEESLVEAIVWFSSGGTSSVVHTDEVDNLNCLVRGNKSFLLVDPALYGDHVPIDVVNGAYSTIDVDAVDFAKYPKMHDVQFYLADMKQGDCLYVPFKWIHQVRSIGRNLAVNLWWDSSIVPSGATEHCSTSGMDTNWFIDPTKLKGFHYRSSKNVILEAIERNNSMKPMSFESLVSVLSPDHQVISEKFGNEYLSFAMELFSIFDQDRDELLDHSEVHNLSAKIVQAGNELLHKLELKITELLNKLDKLEKEKDEL